MFPSSENANSWTNLILLPLKSLHNKEGVELIKLTWPFWTPTHPAWSEPVKRQKLNHSLLHFGYSRPGTGIDLHRNVPQPLVDAVYGSVRETADARIWTGALRRKLSVHSRCNYPCKQERCPQEIHLSTSKPTSARTHCKLAFVCFCFTHHQPDCGAGQNLFFSRHLRAHVCGCWHVFVLLVSICVRALRSAGWVDLAQLISLSLFWLTFRVTQPPSSCWAYNLQGLFSWAYTPVQSLSEELTPLVCSEVWKLRYQWAASVCKCSASQPALSNSVQQQRRKAGRTILEGFGFYSCVVGWNLMSHLLLWKICVVQYAGWLIRLCA